MMLRLCYAVCGTELGNVATLLRPDQAYDATLLLRGVRYWASVCCYACTLQCAVLSSRMLLCRPAQATLRNTTPPSCLRLACVPPYPSPIP
eukprot:1463107-Rhodomonas_salina.1